MLNDNQILSFLLIQTFSILNLILMVATINYKNIPFKTYKILLICVLWTISFLPLTINFFLKFNLLDQFNTQIHENMLFLTATNTVILTIYWFFVKHTRPEKKNYLSYLHCYTLVYTLGLSFIFAIPLAVNLYLTFN